MVKNATLILAIALIFSGVFFLFNKKEKTCYVQIQKTFNGFDYKKEMEAKLKRVQEIRTKELDSLELELKIKFKEIELNKKDATLLATFQAQKEAFLKKRETYEQDYARIVSEYDEIIVKQMNQYIKEFGEKNNYKYIFGTDGKGNLMYADSTGDVTPQVLAFINEKYKGKTK